MYAIRQYEFGPADTLRYEQVPDPLPGPGQVRVTVAAAGVHNIDTAIRAGRTDGMPFGPPELPMTPGREVAGVVDGLGDGVDEKWLGRRVVGHLGMASGGYAELAVREVEALHVLPDGMDFDVAVAMIGTGRTAQAVLHAAGLRPDDVVLVTAAASGMGNLLVQTARGLGATVIGAAGGDAKVERLRRLGVDLAVDYSTEDWADRLERELPDRRPTVVLDQVSGAIGRAALDTLAPGGRFVIVSWASGAPIELSTQDLYARAVTMVPGLGPHAIAAAGGMRVLESKALAEAAAGRWKPVTQRFDLAKASEAHAAVEQRGTVGKVILVP